MKEVYARIGQEPPPPPVEEVYDPRTLYEVSRPISPSPRRCLRLLTQHLSHTYSAFKLKRMQSKKSLTKR